ncbi:hypothetical protein HPB48_006656 [Haemaphysalis longicornis]|uniref:Uncharacterized protein n=1 Tax=Haemaphysalis longicornis TaxID=44386 RepID=A0A9J6GHY4_HAELO|nr:hypothetical protein HPB48_006656 [Haemaphysalis longicornis]
MNVQEERYGFLMNIDSFKEPEDWLARFKDLHGLMFKTMCGERGEVDREVVKEWQNPQLKNHMAAYDSNDVFNADETAGFLMRCEIKLTFKLLSCSGGKEANSH